jgi:PAS domain S-box-containing protein
MALLPGAITYFFIGLGYYVGAEENTLVYYLIQFGGYPLLIGVFFILVDQIFRFKEKIDLILKVFLFTFFFTAFMILSGFLPGIVFDITRSFTNIFILIFSFFLIVRDKTLTNVLFLLSMTCFAIASTTMGSNISSGIFLLEFSTIFTFYISYIFLGLIFFLPGGTDNKKSMKSYFSLEKKLTIIEEALKASEERYKKIVQASSNGILIADQKTMKFKYANPSICRMLGYNKAEMEQLGVADIYPKENLQEITSTFEELASGKKTTAENIPCLKKDGDIIYVDIQTVGILFGEEKTFIVFFNDVTEKKIMSEKIQEKMRFLESSEKATLNIMEDLEETTKKLGRLSQIKSAFLNITSHELRTPMSAIKGYIQMLLRGNLGTINEEQKNALGIVLRNSNRLDRLIQDILDISRLESGTMKFVPGKIDVEKMIKEVDETMQASAGLKGIKINTEIERDISELHVDKDRISQVVINILNNAIKFSPEGSIINVRVKKQDDDVLFEVQDFGRGIPKEHHQKIFQTFYQVDSGTDVKFGGAGLGLAICYGIVFAHGGRIWVESTGKPGEGSTFRFTLPIESVSDIEKRFRGVDIFGLGTSANEYEDPRVNRVLGEMGRLEIQTSTSQDSHGEADLSGETRNNIVDETQNNNSIKKINELNKNLELQNIQLQKLNEIKATFLKNTSHELRTPITAIKGYVQMLMIRTLGEINEDQRKSLEVILRNTNRLDQVIQNILDVSNLQAGTLKFIPGKVNPMTLIEETTKMMQSFAYEKEMTINVDLKKDLPDLIVDAGRIKQVMKNLIENAIKFSPDGSVINVKARKEKEDILFEVQDFGIGIPKDKQEEIFEIFHQIDSGDDRKLGGTGLGLALSKGIVVLHGGKMWVESTEGKGSMFRFTLPIKLIYDIENTDLDGKIYLKEEKIIGT